MDVDAMSALIHTTQEAITRFGKWSVDWMFKSKRIHMKVALIVLCGVLLIGSALHFIFFRLPTNESIAHNNYCGAWIIVEQQPIVLLILYPDGTYATQTVGVPDMGKKDGTWMLNKKCLVLHEKSKPTLSFEETLLGRKSSHMTYAIVSCNEKKLIVNDGRETLEWYRYQEE